MFEVRLDRDYYSKHSEIFKWCCENICDYYKPDITRKEAHKNDRWAVEIMFGYQTYTFQNEEDAAWFMLKWGNDG